jgi:hypothetical protein
VWGPKVGLANVAGRAERLEHEEKVGGKLKLKLKLEGGKEGRVRVR